MSDAELEYLVSSNIGESFSRSPFYESAIKKDDKEKVFYNELDYEAEDDSITPGTMGNHIPDESIEDLPDDTGDIEQS